MRLQWCWFGIPVVILKSKSALGLYEDEVGLNDWHMPLIGRAKIVVPGGLHTACVATNKTVIACLDVSPASSLHIEGARKSLLWRAVLDAKDSVQALAFSGSDSVGRLLSVSGDRSVTRMWDSRSGSLQWEMPVMEEATCIDGDSRKVAALLGGPRGHAIVTTGNKVICLNSNNGAILWSWLAEDESLKLTDINILSGGRNGGGYAVAGFTFDKETDIVSIVTVQLSFDGVKVGMKSTKLGKGPQALKNGNGVFFTATEPNGEVDFHLLACALHPNGKKILTLDVETRSAAEVDLGCSEMVSEVWPLFNGDNRVMGVHYTQNGLDVEISASIVDGKLKTSGDKLFCALSRESGACHAGMWRTPGSYDLENLLPKDHTVVGAKRGRLDAVFPFASTTLSLFEDDSLVLSGAEEGVIWSREESLSSILSAAIFDIESEENSTPPDHHVPSYFARLSMHAESGRKFIMNLLQFNGEPIGISPLSKGDMDFGLGKLAVVLTESGKLCGLNLVTENIEWSRMEQHSKTGAIYTTRPRPVLGYDAEFALLVKSPDCMNIVWADALTGKEMLRETISGGVRAFPVDIFDAEDRQIILVVTSDNGVIPARDSSQIRQVIASHLPHIFDHSIDSTGVMSYVIEPRTNTSMSKGYSSSTPFVSSLIGSINWGKSSRVVSVAHGNPLEVVALPAHIMGDDSLLLKYINPHLVVVATLTAQGLENGVEGGLLTITLLDTVNAKVLHRITHESAAEPVHAVVYENNVVYSYWSAGAKRTEVGSISLYEGMIDKYGLSPWGEKQEWHPSFSSFDSHTPIALQKTYIFPHLINGMAVTMTANGISPKHVLVALNHGQVAVLDRAILDPRRPEAELTKMEKEEKLIRYTPHLPAIRNTMPTHKYHVARVNKMATRPSHLESTTILLAWGGLDIFSGRVIPSTTFDILAPDFSYQLLILVIVALICTAFAMSSYVMHKKLVSQWA